MNDCGTDPEAFSSTMDFYLNGGASTNGVCPIDLEPVVSRGEQGLQVVYFDSKVEDSSDSSDEDAEDDVLKMKMRQTCGDYSNAAIEELWNEKSRPNKPGKVTGDIRRKLCDEVREKASHTKLKKNLPVPAPSQLQPELQPEKKRKKNRRPKCKNVAIESILEIKGISTGPVSTVQENLGACGSLSAPKNNIGNGLKPLGRGRGRLLNASRKDNVMIRPENIHGYYANPDYDPNNPNGNNPLKLDEFPPLI